MLYSDRINNHIKKLNDNPGVKKILLAGIYLISIIINVIFLIKYFPNISYHSEKLYSIIEDFINNHPQLNDYSAFSFLKKVIDILVGTPFLLTCVCISQSVMLILAIKGFLRLSSLIIGNKIILYLAVIVFAAHPSLGVYDGNILTESFAMAGLIFFLANYQRIINTPEKRRLFPLIFNMFFLSFLRSTLLFLIPVGIISFTYLYFKHRNLIYIYALAGSLFILSLHIGVYFFMPEVVSSVKKDNPSGITVDSSDIVDKRASDTLLYRSQGDFFPFSNHNEDSKINIEETIEPKYSLNRIPANFMNSCFYNLGYSGDSDKTLFERIFYYMFFKIPLKLWLVYLMMSFYLGYLIFKYYHFKKMIKIEWIVWIFIFCNIFLMLMSKTMDFNRLIMPVLPLVLILLSQTFYLIIFNAKLLIKKCFFD